MVSAAALFCLLLLPSVLAVLRNRTALRGKRRLLPVVIAAGYPFAMLASISNGSSQVGERATTFIFFGMAVVIAAWIARRLSTQRRPLERAVTILIATICFLGSMIFGSGPDITYVPGPYLVGANQRSIDAPVLAAARWASTHLAAGSVIAADRQAGATVANFADVQLATSIGGFANPAPIFFSQTLDTNDRLIILHDHIRYIVVDRRLSSSLPLFGTYFGPGEAKPGTRLTPYELGKFDSASVMTRIYDNGTIVIYRVALPGPTGPPGTAAPAGADPVVLVAAVAVAIFSYLRVRRRRRQFVTGPVVMKWLVGGMAGGMAIAAIAIPRPWSPTLVGLGGLAIVLALVLAATWTGPPATEDDGIADGGRPRETGPDQAEPAEDGHEHPASDLG
jgi:hypothetical protein